MPPRFVAKQLAHPSGLGGAIIRFLMNRGNRRLNGLALELLNLGPADRVLEVGFGGGIILYDLISRAAFVCGIDRADDAVATARRRFAGAIDAGKAEFKVGSVERLPVAPARFDKALTVNTVYFWRSLDEGVSEIRRSLAPGGKLVVGFVPKLRMDRMNMPADIFTPRTPEDICSAMRSSGFSGVEIHSPWGNDGPMAALGTNLARSHS
jgi:SAM-dependent methyltransferase